MKFLLLYFVQKIRKEKLEVGNFTNTEILRILFFRGINLLNGILYYILRFKMPKLIFFRGKFKINRLKKNKILRVKTTDAAVRRTKRITAPKLKIMACS